MEVKPNSNWTPFTCFGAVAAKEELLAAEISLYVQLIKDSYADRIVDTMWTSLKRIELKDNKKNKDKKHKDKKNKDNRSWKGRYGHGQVSKHRGPLDSKSRDDSSPGERNVMGKRQKSKISRR